MISLETAFVFLGASVAVTLAPGPDNLFILTQGLSRGRRDALVTAWGMCSGISVHTVAAALGLSAVIYASSWAFTVLKGLGALYLFFIAFQTIRNRHRSFVQPKAVSSATRLEAFRRGFLMNVLNPKVGLFFLAFLPQFVDSESGHRMGQMFLLGGLFMFQATLLFSLLAHFAGTFGGYLLRNARMRSVLSWLAASVFVGLGIRLILDRE